MHLLAHCPLWRLPISRSIGAYKGVYDGCQICRGIVAAEEIVLPSECQQPNGILDEVVADVDPTVIQKPMQVSCIRLNLFTCIIFHRTRPDLARVFNTFRMGNISPYNYFIRGNFIPTLYNLTYPDILSNSGSFSRLNVKNSFLSWSVYIIKHFMGVALSSSKPSNS